MHKKKKSTTVDLRSEGPVHGRRLKLFSVDDNNSGSWLLSRVDVNGAEFWRAVGVTGC
jgi:hypothetical protein